MINNIKSWFSHLFTRAPKENKPAPEYITLFDGKMTRLVITEELLIEHPALSDAISGFIFGGAIRRLGLTVKHKVVDGVSVITVIES